MVKANLRILLNCCYEPQFKVYAGAFDWSTLLPRLLNSGTGAVQLATKFISSCLASGLPDACESFWKLKGSEADLLLKTLGKIIQTGEDPVEVNDFSFSSLDLIIGMQKCSDCSDDNLQLLASQPILPVLSVALGSGQPQEKLAVCLLLWSLLSVSQTRECHQSEVSCLTEQLSELALSSDTQLKDVSECILMVLKGQDFKGELLLCVHAKVTIISILCAFFSRSC